MSNFKKVTHALCADLAGVYIGLQRREIGHTMSDSGFKST